MGEQAWVVVIFVVYTAILIDWLMLRRRYRNRLKACEDCRIRKELLRQRRDAYVGDLTLADLVAMRKKDEAHG